MSPNARLRFVSFCSFVTADDWAFPHWLLAAATPPHLLASILSLLLVRPFSFPPSDHICSCKPWNATLFLRFCCACAFDLVSTMPRSYSLRSKLSRANKRVHRSQPYNEPAPPSTTDNVQARKAYEYQPLDREAREIRLLKLLPGEFDDPLQLEIFHVPLVEPEPAPDTRLSLGKIRGTLPEGWAVSQTIEGLYIFDRGYVETAQWTHPDPTVEESWYQANAVLDPYPGFEPVYEARYSMVAR